MDPRDVDGNMRPGRMMPHLDWEITDPDSRRKMNIARHVESRWTRRRLRRMALLLAACTTILFASKMPQARRVWSVGPLTKSESVMGLAVGPGGGTVSGPQLDSQTGSVFNATRSVVFAGDRIVLASQVGTREVQGRQGVEHVFQLLSLDAGTGQVKNTREMTVFMGSLWVFATDDNHVIVSGENVLRLTPDLKDDGAFDYHATGHKWGRVDHISPDGSTLGNETSPGFEFLDARTLKVTPLTDEPADVSSISRKGYVTDNDEWVGDYPKERAFITFVDAADDHLLHHGDCGERPQFLTDDLVLVQGCKDPFLVDTRGTLVRTLPVKGEATYAGVSQDGRRFALQLRRSARRERFVIYSMDTGQPVTEIEPEEPAEEQSWTAFSHDGTMFVVGSPLKLTLYRLP
jgi:hypothetical protein